VNDVTSPSLLTLAASSDGRGSAENLEAEVVDLQWGAR
jgi:hypothetical protein